MNRVIARFADGHLEKGTTLDFFPGREHFHVVPRAPTEREIPLAIRTADLKALFFVKDFMGDPLHVERQEFDSAPAPEALRILTRFTDGEVLVGTTVAYHPGIPGFFVTPADSTSNNERCYVISSSTDEVRVI